jgi:hypothetical protein
VDAVDDAFLDASIGPIFKVGEFSATLARGNPNVGAVLSPLSVPCPNHNTACRLFEMKARAEACSLKFPADLSLTIWICRRGSVVCDDCARFP